MTNDNLPQKINFEEIVVPERHPMIYQKIDKFDFNNPIIDPIEFALGLAHVMVRHNALGLSANQFGVPIRAFAMASNPVIVCFNPIIVDFSEEKIKLDEGCLSFTNMILEVERPRIIKVRYTQPNKEVITTQFQDLTARIFQHELDHLNGIAFTKHVSTMKLESAKQEKKRLDRLNALRQSVKPTIKV